MIKNKLQYRITKRKLKDFQKEIEYIEQSNKSALEKELFTNAISSEIEILERELNYYDNLSEKRIIHIEFSKLPQAIIEARIAKGWTHAELAQKVGVKEQQIQRYEATDYASTSFCNLVHIADTLGMKMDDFKVVINRNNFNIEEYDACTILTATKTIQNRKSLLPIV